MSKTALIIGATGLVGSALVKKLATDDRFDAVHTFGRKASDVGSSSHQAHVVDFDKPESWNELLKGDVLFSALGTTLKKAGSKEDQYRIDFTYQYEAAQAAAQNGVLHYVLVSAAGASTKSNVFYSKMKGELEEAVIKLPFEKITIIQPSLLTGPRKEFRLGEKIFSILMFPIRFIPILKRYRPISGDVVAQAMIIASLKPSLKRVQRVALGEVFELAKA